MSDFGYLHGFQVDTWYRTDQWNAPENVVVETKIDDAQGKRNEQRLRRSGNLWFEPTGQTYVYYQPTHFKMIRKW